VYYSISSYSYAAYGSRTIEHRWTTDIMQTMVNKFEITKVNELSGIMNQDYIYRKKNR
jgi:hypothetical protein